MTESKWIVETTAETFNADVVERSRELPVVVDFWAPWCHPCRLLGPLLEKLAIEYDGKFVLVKADTDQLPQYASSFGVQGIPAVFAVRDATIVDAFTGVLPEDQLRTWLDRIQPSEIEQLVAEAQSLEASDRAAAESAYRRALELDADHVPATLGLAELLLSLDRVSESQELVERLSQRGFLEPEAEKLRSELALRTAADEVPDVAQCRAALAADPQDLELKWKLAQALIGARQFEEGLELCLQVVQADRKGLGEQARQAMVDVFHMLGRESEVTTTYQRRLSAALY